MKCVTFRQMSRGLNLAKNRRERGEVSETDVLNMT